MERDDIHGLTAAYALDALDEADEREYETHLRTCERCRGELAELGEAAASLAYAVDAPPPPAAVRERILERAAGERTNVVPLRRWRAAAYAGAAAAAAAASVAIGVGIWAASLADRLDDERAVSQLLAEPGTRVVEFSGVTARLVVAESGEAVVVVSGLEEAAEGRTYQLWVIEGEEARPAGLFRSERERHVVPLERPVPAGATVAVTVERAGGAERPTGEPFAVAST